MLNNQKQFSNLVQQTKRKSTLLQLNITFYINRIKDKKNRFLDIYKINAKLNTDYLIFCLSFKP